MVIQQTRPAMTIDEFERYIAQPEHADQSFEYIAGRAVEVTSNSYASSISNLIAALITMFVLEHKLGHVTGSDGGYRVSGERYIPDVGYISYAKQKPLGTTGYNPLPPDLAVEVISNPSNKQELEDLRRKITNYLAAGTIVWVFDWSEEQAEVHAPGQPVTVYEKADTINGGDVLPGFTLKLTDVYRETPQAD